MQHGFDAKLLGIGVWYRFATYMLIYHPKFEHFELLCSITVRNAQILDDKLTYRSQIGTIHRFLKVLHQSHVAYPTIYYTE
jgi:hypothetical protein